MVKPYALLFQKAQTGNVQLYLYVKKDDNFELSQEIDCLNNFIHNIKIENILMKFWYSIL